MKKISLTFFTILMFAVLSYAQQANGWPDKEIRKVSSRISDYQPERYQILNINNIITWAREDGQSNHSPTGKNGAIFPRGTTNIIYQDGLIWGSKVYLDQEHSIPAPFDQTIRVGGARSAPAHKQGGWRALDP